MNKKEKIVTSEEQLVQLRKESLRNATEVNSIRAHGKVMGKELFTWKQPNVDQIASMLKNFPFDVTWITTPKEVTRFYKFYSKDNFPIREIIVFGINDNMLNRKQVPNDILLMSTNTINDALNLFQSTYGKTVLISVDKETIDCYADIENWLTKVK